MMMKMMTMMMMTHPQSWPNVWLSALAASCVSPPTAQAPARRKAVTGRTLRHDAVTTGTLPVTPGTPPTLPQK